MALDELTGLIDLTGYPDGTRIIVRRERRTPGPDCRCSTWTRACVTRCSSSTHPSQEADRRNSWRSATAHRVEDRIRCGKTTGLGRFPSRHFAINAAWLELSLTAIDLLAWTRMPLLDGEPATAEPKKPRYRLPHTAAPITRGGRRLRLRIAAALATRADHSIRPPRSAAPAGHLSRQTVPDHPRPEESWSTRPHAGPPPCPPPQKRR
ncbi:transposase [Streptomyces sp. NPDC004752]